MNFLANGYVPERYGKKVLERTFMSTISIPIGPFQQVEQRLRELFYFIFLDFLTTR